MLEKLAEEVRVGEAARQGAWVLVVGSVNVDLVAAVERLPMAGETVAGQSFAALPGGKGANQAAAVARLGCRAELLAQGGDDALSAVAWEALGAAGVGLRWTERVPGPSGTALILTAGGHNTIAVVPGANATLTPEVLEARWPAVLEQRPAVVLAQMEVPLATVGRLAEMCGAAGVPLMLDPAPAQELPDELLQAVTWLTPNETEAERLCGERPRADELPSLQTVSGRLLARGVQNVALKLGAAGVWLAGACGEQRVEAPRVRAVDSTAAGDCWNGAFAVALLRGDEAGTAARWACAAAALSTTRAGTMPSLPTGDEVERWLRRQGPVPGLGDGGGGPARLG